MTTSLGTDGGDRSPLERSDDAKRAAALHAAEMVRDGMRVGLGTGSTAVHLVRRLGERVREGLRFRAVATSQGTERLAREVGIEVVTLDDAGRLDLAIDGADEFDGRFDLVKGGGGALLREKIVATCAERMVVIADASKEVAALGAFPLPIEVVPFGWSITRRALEEAVSGLGTGGQARPRIRGGHPFVTDGGNRIVDLHLGHIEDPWRTSVAVNQVPGVVENGLFLGVCDLVVIGHPDGRVETREAAPRGADDERNAFAAI